MAKNNDSPEVQLSAVDVHCLLVALARQIGDSGGSEKVSLKEILDKILPIYLALHERKGTGVLITLLEGEE